MTDGHKIYKGGVCIGYGTGPVNLQEGETFVLVDSYNDDPDIKASEAAREITAKLEYYAQRDRNFTAKYQTALEYIQWRNSNPSITDDADYRESLPDSFLELYDEYFATYKGTPYTPLELAQIIVAKHETALIDERQRASLAEAELRRQKLELEASITPEIQTILDR